jgi:FkbM family methyltransferase
MTTHRLDRFAQQMQRLMKLAANPSAVRDRVVRRLIRRASPRGFAGRVGQFVGRHVGWPMRRGGRIVIDDANEYIQQEVLAHGAYEPNLADLIAGILEPGDVFFDIGGNIGNHTIIAASTGADVSVFEPIPRLAARIRASLDLNSFAGHVMVVEKACGAESGFAVIHIAKGEDDGSHSLIPGVYAKNIQTLNVRVITLDEHVASSPCPPPILMKIDVEGYEARVLDGAHHLLRSATPPALIIETGDRLADQIGESAASVLGRLTQLGYELFRLPERGFVDPTPVSGITGKLNNYFCIPPGFRKRETALGVLERLA